MANVTFIIGNGFDLNIGLKTSYLNFYEKYTKDIRNDSNVIKRFKDSIINQYEQLWKDFEYGIGQWQEFDNKEDFLNCFGDFVTKFNKYIKVECENIDWDKTQKQYNEFETSILNFYKYLTQIEEDEIKKFAIDSRGNFIMKANFLQFNYTDAFDKLLNGINPGYSSFFGTNVHIHGTIDDHPTMGLNDLSQLKKNFFKNDSAIQQIIIKPEYLNNLQKANINKKIPRAKAIEIIDLSDIFCAFGTSIGETDKYWWEKIGDRLKKSENAYFIIFSKDISLKEEKIDPIAIYNYNQTKEKTTRQIIERFVRLSGLEEEWLTNGRIIVELNNPDMFKFSLPFKPLKESEENILQTSS